MDRLCVATAPSDRSASFRAPHRRFDRSQQAARCARFGTRAESYVPNLHLERAHGNSGYAACALGSRVVLGQFMHYGVMDPPYFRYAYPVKPSLRNDERVVRAPLARRHIVSCARKRRARTDARRAAVVRVGHCGRVPTASSQPSLAGRHRQLDGARGQERASRSPHIPEVEAHVAHVAPL